MHPPEVFQYCPRCAAAVAQVGANPFVCGGCGLTFFFNPCVAAAVFLSRPDGQVLFFRRAKDPAKGKLAIPGGFLDYDESAEAGVRRETREEVGLEVTHLRYLGSWVNHYPYKGLVYPVVDLIFAGVAANPDAATPLDAVASLEWRRLRDVDPDELAFPSLRGGWRVLTGESTA
jgi:ADP-ribose pyrophosphatase YjhB (NUDIX family)